jgi:tRNA pseudouridine65 synthase
VTPLRIIFENTQYLAVSKPPQLLVHRTQESSDTESLVSILRDQYEVTSKSSENIESAATQYRLSPLHRLDRAASGIVLFAKSPQAMKEAQNLWSHSDTEKFYWALVRGNPGSSGRISRPLKNDSGIIKEAETLFTQVELYEVAQGRVQCSLLRVQIKTGRRNQIRRHFANPGVEIPGHFQLAGDVNIGKGWFNRIFRDEYDFHRLFLHHHRLKIPSLGLDLNDPLSQECQTLLDRLALETKQFKHNKQ